MDFDAEIFAGVVEEEIGSSVDRNWSQYNNVTDSGILAEIISLHQLSDDKLNIEENVKRKFVARIGDYLKSNSAKEVNGASAFVKRLKSMDDIEISIATGGWYETTVLKLKSAGLLFPDVFIASSSDHHSRTEIMKISRLRSNGQNDIPCTYFGDATWDKIACAKLGYNFVLVGDQANHDQQIPDFTDYKQAMAYIVL
ncbi:MAG: HAD hydrolase-like protein [Gammaproteobacteria bacterium]|nr:HAD hydrolase-like protein [Gammaproteobacteria bacterium]